MSQFEELRFQLNEPDAYFPDNFDTPKRANALLMCLCQEAADAIKSLERQLAESEDGVGSLRDLVEQEPVGYLSADREFLPLTTRRKDIAPLYLHPAEVETLERERDEWRATAEQHKENFDILNGDLRVKLAAVTAQRDLLKGALIEINEYVDQTYADLIGNLSSEWLASRIVGHVNPVQALHSALADAENGMQDVLIIGYDAEGDLYIRSSAMNCSEAFFMANKAMRWAESGGEE